MVIGYVLRTWLTVPLSLLRSMAFNLKERDGVKHGLLPCANSHVQSRSTATVSPQEQNQTEKEGGGRKRRRGRRAK